MVCAEPCEHHFCWTCLGPTEGATWEDHATCGVDLENSEPATMTREQVRAKLALERFLHYQHLWMRSLQRRRVAERELWLLRDVELELPAGAGAAMRYHSDAVAKAWEQVAEGHRVLGNACAHGQSLRGANTTTKARQELFECQRAQADAMLERLENRASMKWRPAAPKTTKGLHGTKKGPPAAKPKYEELLEELAAEDEDALKKFDTELANLTLVTRRCIESFTKAMEDGLPDASGHAAAGEQR